MLYEKSTEIQNVISGFLDRKQSPNLIFIVQKTEYFFIQMFKRVFHLSGNEFRTAVSVVKRHSGFFLKIAEYLFFRNWDA